MIKFLFLISFFLIAPLLVAMQNRDFSSLKSIEESDDTYDTYQSLESIRKQDDMEKQAFVNEELGGGISALFAIDKKAPGYSEEIAKLFESRGVIFDEEGHPYIKKDVVEDYVGIGKALTFDGMGGKDIAGMLKQGWNGGACSLYSSLYAISRIPNFLQKLNNNMTELYEKKVINGKKIYVLEGYKFVIYNTCEPEEKHRTHPGSSHRRSQQKTELRTIQQQSRGAPRSFFNSRLTPNNDLMRIETVFLKDIPQQDKDLYPSPSPVVRAYGKAVLGDNEKDKSYTTYIFRNIFSGEKVIPMEANLTFLEDGYYFEPNKENEGETFFIGDGFFSGVFDSGHAYSVFYDQERKSWYLYNNESIDSFGFGEHQINNKESFQDFLNRVFSKESDRFQMGLLLIN